MVWLIVSSGWRLNVRSNLSTQFTHNENIRCDSLQPIFVSFQLLFVSCLKFRFFFSFIEFVFLFILVFSFYFLHRILVLLSIVQFSIIDCFSFTQFTALFGSHCIWCELLFICENFWHEIPNWRNKQKKFNTHKTSKRCQRFGFNVFVYFSFELIFLVSFLFTSVAVGCSLPSIAQTLRMANSNTVCRRPNKNAFGIVFTFCFFFLFCGIKIVFGLYYICNKAALLMRSTCQNKPGQYLI